ncbi:MAG: hypothetical protein ACK5P7_05080 [Bdellovibrio sp.]|jgi:hypothetical protein
MNSVKRYLKAILVLVIVAFATYIFVEFYPFIFSKKVVGVIENVERIQLNVSLMQNSGDAGANSTINPQLFSFSVAIKSTDGEIHTSSAEDRQWAVAQKGQCVEAVLYPYPPWKLMKGGTYFNARLDKLFECQVPN